MCGVFDRRVGWCSRKHRLHSNREWASGDGHGCGRCRRPGALSKEVPWVGRGLDKWRGCSSRRRTYELREGVIRLASTCLNGRRRSARSPAEVYSAGAVVIGRSPCCRWVGGRGFRGGSGGGCRRCPGRRVLRPVRRRSGLGRFGPSGSGRGPGRRSDGR